MILPRVLTFFRRANDDTQPIRIVQRVETRISRDPYQTPLSYLQVNKFIANSPIRKIDRALDILNYSLVR